MKTFTDNAGHTWTVAVNVDAIKRVRDLIGVDLLAAGDGPLLNQLASDPIMLCNVLYVLCKPEADARNISDEDFGRGMGGDAIDFAVDALMAEIIAFFPKARRQVLSRAVEKLRVMTDMAANQAMQKLETLDLNALMRQASGDPSGKSPEASASTPAPSP